MGEGNYTYRLVSRLCLGMRLRHDCYQNVTENSTPLNPAVLFISSLVSKMGANTINLALVLDTMTI